MAADSPTPNGVTGEGVDGVEVGGGAVGVGGGGVSVGGGRVGVCVGSAVAVEVEVRVGNIQTRVGVADTGKSRSTAPQTVSSIKATMGTPMMAFMDPLHTVARTPPS